MTAVVHDAGGGGNWSGLGFAVASAASFGASGALARGLMDAGWSAGAAVTARIVLAAAVLAVPGVLAVRGRWHLLRRGLPVLVGYGLFAVAVTQLCYFYAVAHLQVGVALLIEFTAPVAVVLWLWATRGQRPRGLTLLGILLAGGGLVLVLDVVSGSDLDPVGVLWAVGAMVGATVYFVMSGHEGVELPGITLAAGGLVSGAVFLAGAGLAGLLPMHVTTATSAYRGYEVAWWLPVLLLGLVTAAFAYVAGIGAARRLGSRLASFVALLEVLTALLFAWLLLAELPSTVQLGGGVLVVVGIVVVKLGERPVPRVTGRPADAGAPPGGAAAAPPPPGPPAGRR